MLLSKFPRIIAALSFINYAFHLKTYILRLSRDAISDVLWITIIAIVAHHVTWYHSRLITTQVTQTQWVILASVSQQLLIPRPLPRFSITMRIFFVSTRGRRWGTTWGCVCPHSIYSWGHLARDVAYSWQAPSFFGFFGFFGDDKIRDKQIGLTFLNGYRLSITFKGAELENIAWRCQKSRVQKSFP